MKNTHSATTKSSTGRKPRNRSVKSTGLGRTPMGACSTVKVLMIRLENVGPVATMTAKQDLTLATKTIDHRTRTILADAPAHVPAGTTLHFVASSLLGWYYIVRVASPEHIFCTCPASQNRLHCEHADLALEAYKAHKARENRQIADEFVAVSPQLEDKKLPEDAHFVPTECIENVQENEEFSEAIEQEWTQEELAKTKSYAEQLQVATTTEERKAIWKRVQADARIRDKAAATEYWGKVHELREAKAS